MTLTVTWYNPREKVHGTQEARDPAHAKRLASQIESLGNTDVQIIGKAPKRYLKVLYDVTGLSEDEIGQLAFEATVQAEASDGHPSVEVESYTFEDEDN